MQKRFSALLCLLVLTCTAAVAGDWPMGAYDAGRTGFNATETRLAPPLEPDWTAVLPGKPETVSIADGKAFVSIGVATGGASANAVAVLQEATGIQDYIYYLYNGGGSMGCPVTAGGGYIFFTGQSDDRLYTLNASTYAEDLIVTGFGNLYTRPPAYADGRVFVVGLTKVTGIDVETPTSSWEISAAYTDQVCAVVGGGRLYYVENGDLVAVNQNDGSHDWTVPGILGNFETPVYSNGKIYAAHTGSTVMALYADSGAVDWSVSFPLTAVCLGELGPVTVAGNVVLVTLWKNGVGNGELVALDAADGSELWHFEDNGEGLLRPAVANGYVYVSGWLSQNLYALDIDTGVPVWTQPFDTKLLYGPTVANGRLYICEGNTVYTFKAIEKKGGCFAARALPAAPEPPGSGELMLYGLVALLFVAAAFGRRQHALVGLRSE